jgi:hypothetical protein
LKTVNNGGDFLFYPTFFTISGGIEMKNQTNAKTPEQYIYSFYMENKHKANEKITVLQEEAQDWFQKLDGNETITILGKAITLGGGKDSTWIKLSDAQLRMLFMTGDGKEKGGRSPNSEQLAAKERAANRFNDMKRRGLLDGNIHCFCVTLYGMEYYRSKTADK